MEVEDSSSPDEKDFPGLFERNSSKSKKGSEESDATSDIPGKKPESKKDKKSKEKKDRQSYEALGGESEEEDQEAKLFRSPSKSKKSTFKFPSKKEKREKSREPDLKDVTDGCVVVKDKKGKDEKKKSKKDKEKKSKSGSLSSNEVFGIGGENFYLLKSKNIEIYRAIFTFHRHPAHLRRLPRPRRRTFTLSRSHQTPTRRTRLHRLPAGARSVVRTNLQDGRR